MLLLLLASHAMAGLLVLLASRRLGRWGLVLGGLAPALATGWVASQASSAAHEPLTQRVRWVPALGLTLDVRLDAFSVLMTFLVSGIGVLVFAYAWSYFGHAEKVGRAAGLLTLFAGSMLGVVLADNLLMLYICWEITSVTSYLLISIDDFEESGPAAALHALLITGLGGLAMLGGFVLLGQQAGTYRISEIVADPPTGAAVDVALVLVLLGAFTKSAQYPFHSWLPAAMVAPTPISAYLHSAAMVKAGVYLVARLAPAFAAAGAWRPLVVTVGLVTMIAGGLRALRPFDLKQLLAFGTVSQLGFMTVLLGVGHPKATAAGCALLLAHGLFKAASFMAVGIVDHETHTRDIRRLPPLRRGWRTTLVIVTISAASMAAVPPLAGFIAKEEAFAALLKGGSTYRLVLVGIVTGSALTVAYSIRFAMAFLRADAVVRSEDRPTAPEQGPGRWFVAPGLALAAMSLLLGVAPGLWSSLVDRAARALDPSSEAHLALWHGASPALLLSIATLAAGTALFVARRPVALVQARFAPTFTGAEGYHAAVSTTLRLAGRVTSVVQSGSLPVYAAVILTTAAIAPSAAMLSGRWWPGWPEVVGRPAHLPIAALLIGGAVATTLARRRFAAALLLGVVGYGMAIFFVVQGAPDLALTQFAIETLSVVVFLLVLRRLPDYFERRRPVFGRAFRLGVSAAVGAFVVLMALAASGARTQPPVSAEMSERALPEGDGKNVVNVILVDIRGLDTLGEITVLVAAAIGVVALARAGEAPRLRPTPPRPLRLRRRRP